MIPQFVLAAGWIPFSVVCLMILAFSCLYVKHYQSSYERNVPVYVAGVLALSFTLATSALLPSDVFLVSFMKFSNGTFRVWASESTRASIEDAVSITYYVLYAIVTSFAFFFLPFSYFYYEERDEELSGRARCLAALRYTLVVVLFAVLLLGFGAFVPMEYGRGINGTSWEKVEHLIDDLGRNGGEDAIGFVINILSLMGFIVVAVYTGFGIASWPITLMKGARPLDEEAVQIRRRRMEIEQRRTGSSHSPDRDLDVANNTLSRQERELERLSSNRFLRYCNLAMRPFEMVAGLGLLGVGLLVFISLLLTNIDRSLNSLGMRSGYALTKRTLPNPLESVLMQAEAYFPFNLALFGAFVIYLVFATMNGVRRIGIRVCGIKLYRIRAHRTRPQGVLLLCTILIFAVLALNMLVYMLAPTYVTFGSQRYIGGVDGHYGNLFDQHWYAEVDGKLINCDLNGVPDDCILTRASVFIIKYFLSGWYFGAIYFWLSWCVLLSFVVGIIATTVQSPTSSVEEAVDEDDFEQSDEEGLFD